jgi:hypothetical protein
MTQTERTLKAIKAEWVNAERERIWTAIDAIDPIDWALGSAYYMIETIVRGES